MIKYLVGVLGVVLIAVGGYYAWHALKIPGGATRSAASSGAAVATSTYATSTFAIVYPRDFTVDDSYIYDRVNPKKPISGVKFTIPGAMATGTNLSSDSYLAVERLPHAKHCTGDIYLAANVKTQKVTDGGVAYSLATSTGAAAGNRYEESVYALASSSPCTAVRYFIHSTAIENHPSGAVREFDHSALAGVFDQIRRTLALFQSVQH